MSDGLQAVAGELIQMGRQCLTSEYAQIADFGPPRSEIGVGIDTGILGIYAAHAFSDDAAPVRFEFRFSRRF